MTTVREKIVTAARWGLEHEAEIHYAQVRPMPLSKALPMRTDCSGFVTLCYRLAGAPDPNGESYDGQGYTGTLLRHMQHIPQQEALRGDLVVWGAYPGRHVALVLRSDPDPLLCSHGQERGPIAVSFSVESWYQANAEATWLSNLH